MCITTQVRWFSAETRSSGAIGCGRGSDRRWRLLVLYGEARLRESGTLDPRNNRGVPRGGWVSYAGSILMLSRATRKGWARVVSSRTVWNLCPMGITMGVCFFPSLQLKTKTKTFFIHLRNLDFLWENLNSLAKLDFNCETWFCQKLCKWEWDGAMGSSSFWTCRARGKGWRRKSPVICWNHSALHFRSLGSISISGHRALCTREVNIYEPRPYVSSVFNVRSHWLKVATLNVLRVATLSFLKVATLSFLRVATLSFLKVATLSFLKVATLSFLRVATLSFLRVATLSFLRVATLSFLKVATLSFLRVATLSFLKVATLSFLRVATLSFLKVATLSFLRVATLSFLKVATLSFLRVATLSFLKVATLSFLRVATLSDLQLRLLAFLEWLLYAFLEWRLWAFL